LREKKMKYFQKFMPLLCVLSASMVLVACDEECVETDAGGVCVNTYNDGYYYDNLVTGLAYENRNEAGDVMRTAVTGEGDDPGRFRFLSGQTIAFSLGATDLGETPAGVRVTPFDIAGVEEAAVGECDVSGTLPEDDFRIVHNLAVLLQTMDTDGDPTTAGIEISEEVAMLFDEVSSVEVDQAWEAFQTDLQVVLDEANNRNLFSEERAMRTREEALGALYEGIEICPDGTGGTGGTGGGTGGTGGGTGGTGGG
jgi:hypothetical protein